MAKLYQGEDWRKRATVVSGVQDEYVMTEMEFAEVMQNYQEAWTPKSEAAFKPSTIKNRPVKVDFPFTPKKLEATWIGYLKTNGSKPTEYPFVQYIYEKLIERLKRDLNKCMVQGVYVAATPGVASPAMESFDGILEVRQQAVDASDMTVIATGAITTANIVTKVEQLVDGVDEDFKGLELELFMSEAWRTAYFRKRRDPSFSNYGQGSIDDAVVDFTNVKIVCPKYWTGDGMIITPKGNIVMLEDGVNEEEDMIVQANRRMLEVMMDFKRGVGFGITKDYTWTNDQSLA